MNERIKQLAKQTGFDVELMERNHANGNPSMAHQFAELIIQECADVCQSFGESGDGYTCSYEILEHFGVEE